MRLALRFILIACALSIAAARADEPVSRSALEAAISEGIPHVEEFRYLRAEAERLGVRVYLFGGTAAAYGHYVNWDLRRARGNTSYRGSE